MKKTIGNKIAEYRTKKNMSQYRLAELVGVSPSCVAMWESGKRTPRPEQLKKLSMWLSCPIDILFGKTYGDVFSISAKQEELLNLIEELSDEQVNNLLNVVYMITNPDYTNEPRRTNNKKN